MENHTLNFKEKKLGYGLETPIENHIPIGVAKSLSAKSHFNRSCKVIICYRSVIKNKVLKISISILIINYQKLLFNKYSSNL